MNKLTCWIDGATAKSNPSDCLGLGVVIHEEGDTELSEYTIKVLCENGTNNLAEYLALEKALDILNKNQNHNNKILIHTDSKLVANQMNGFWNIKEGPYTETAQLCKRILKRFTNIRISWIPREENKHADALSKEALTLDF